MQEYDNAPSIPASAERWLLFKLDCWILPTLSLMFLWSFIDKANIANAKIYGLAEDLELQGDEFNTSLLIYFVAYAVFDVPATLVIRSVRPHVWLSACMFVYGMIALCQGFVNSYGGLLGARFFLGVAEACSFSCSFYLVAQWYKRSEAQKRFAIFYSTIQLAGAFSGLIAYGIGHIRDPRGIAPWRWVFIVEGACTSCIAILMFFILPDFPEQSKWVSAAEKAIVLQRLEADENKIADDKSALDLRKVMQIILQPKVLIAGVYYLSSVIPAYAYQYFAPTIINHFTTGAIRTQLISVPPWACGFIAALAVAALSDRLQHRFFFAVTPMLLSVAGYAILLTVHGQEHANAQYGAIFLVVLGIWTALPIILCWTTMNLTRPGDRAVAMGWIIGFGNIGGIPAAYLFQQSQAPNFARGFAVSLALIIVNMLLGVLYATLCWLENQKIARQQPERADGENVVLDAKHANMI